MVKKHWGEIGEIQNLAVLVMLPIGGQGLSVMFTMHSYEKQGDTQATAQQGDWSPFVWDWGNLCRDLANELFLSLCVTMETLYIVAKEWSAQQIPAQPLGHPLPNKVWPMVEV